MNLDPERYVGEHGPQILPIPPGTKIMTGPPVDAKVASDEFRGNFTYFADGEAISLVCARCGQGLGLEPNPSLDLMNQRAHEHLHVCTGTAS